MSKTNDGGSGSTDGSLPTIADLSMLVARLVQQVRKHDPANSVAESAMDYLRRKNLAGSILREQSKSFGSLPPIQDSEPIYPGM